MKRQRIRKNGKRIWGALIILFALMGLIGCSAGSKQDIPDVVQQSSDAVEETGEGADETDLYLVTALDSVEETVQLYRYKNGKEYRFSYAVDTAFYDKYGKRSSVSSFSPGNVVSIGSVDSEGRISAITMADAVWQYDDIVRFSVDEEKGILKIADTNYRITDETRVFSDGEQIAFSDISEQDILSVVGSDRNILSVRITTGHGTLELLNTDLFEGSFLQLNKNIFTEITAGMTLELPEGEYTLTVANNGWGGSCEITVIRGEVVSVDLDEIKGDGPKYGTVRFVFDMDEVYLTIDGATVDYSEPVTLQYGRHTLKAACSGYTEISKYLFVNVADATISISFEEEQAAIEAAEEAAAAEEESESGSSETSSESSESESSITEDDILNDYLSTLTDVIDSL